MFVVWREEIFASESTEDFRPKLGHNVGENGKFYRVWIYISFFLCRRKAKEEEEEDGEATKM